MLLMQKAGGIIALIAGIFGFIAAIITLLAGGLVAGIESTLLAIVHPQKLVRLECLVLFSLF